MQDNQMSSKINPVKRLKIALAERDLRAIDHLRLLH
jgi:hypothetical protein